MKNAFIKGRLEIIPETPRSGRSLNNSQQSSKELDDLLQHSAENQRRIS